MEEEEEVTSSFGDILEECVSALRDLRDSDARLLESCDLRDLELTEGNIALSFGEVESHCLELLQSAETGREREAHAREKGAHLRELLASETSSSRRLRAELEAATSAKGTAECNIAALEVQLADELRQRTALEEELENAVKRGDSAEARVRELCDECAANAKRHAALERRLQASVGQVRYDATVREYEEKLRQNNEKMAGLDRRFKELWHKMKAENEEARGSGSRALEECEARLVAAETARERAEHQAREAAQRAKTVEQRIKELENETIALRDIVRAAREQHTLMRTIAKIRDSDSGKERKPVGFDAVVNTIDSVKSRVDALTTAIPGSTDSFEPIPTHHGDGPRKSGSRAATARRASSGILSGVAGAASPQRGAGRRGSSRRR